MMINKIIDNLDAKKAIRFLSILSHELTVEIRFVLSGEGEICAETIRDINEVIHRITGLITLLVDSELDDNKLEYFEDVVKSARDSMNPSSFSRLVNNFLN